jgi:ribosomal protein S18 acetylase RimI-like enzyme
VNELAPTVISPVRPEVRLLTVADVPRLRLPWDGRFSQADLSRIAAAPPELNVWNSRTGEYLIGGYWRHREKIATVVDIAGSAGAHDLLQGFAELASARGMAMAVASEQAERRKREFYLAAGFEQIEDIIIYELTRVRARGPELRGLRFERFEVDNERNFTDLLALDHRAFPWLWWNSPAEFVEYAGSPGVAIDIGRDPDGRVVAYVGTTRFRSWGHLDRIAVDPTLQGMGLGRAALDYAVMALAAAGARRIGLSTQGNNTASRALYERYGFRRAPSHDYRIYGRRLAADTDHEGRGSELG